MLLPEPCDHVGRGLQLAGFDLTAPQREDLEQRQGLLRLLVTSDILHDRLGLTVLGDDQGFPLHRERAQNLGGMGFEVTDRPDKVNDADGSGDPRERGATVVLLWA